MPALGGLAPRSSQALNQSIAVFNYWSAYDEISDNVELTEEVVLRQLREMVRCSEANDVPLERIDNTGFMVGTTGTCYRRRTAAWEGMLILEHARGGWLNQSNGGNRFRA